MAVRLVLIGVYMFLFAIQGNYRPEAGLTGVDPSSLAYGAEHMPAYKPVSSLAALSQRPDKPSKSIYSFEASCVLMDESIVQAGSHGHPQPYGASPSSSVSIVNSLRGPPCA